VTSPSCDRVRTPTMCLSMMTKDRPVLRGVKVSSVTTCALRMVVQRLERTCRARMKPILGGARSCSGAGGICNRAFVTRPERALLWRIQFQTIGAEAFEIRLVGTSQVAAFIADEPAAANMAYYAPEVVVQDAVRAPDHFLNHRCLRCQQQPNEDPRLKEPSENDAGVERLADAPGMREAYSRGLREAIRLPGRSADRHIRISPDAAWCR
jgi:hypothetical protein